MKATDYQNKVVELLEDIFDKNLVCKEWDSVKNDGHFNNHKLVYAPRLDIAVGPFNSNMNLDIGQDKTEKMKKHFFTKKLWEECLRDRDKMKNIWNKFNRCYLAIEIEFETGPKHAFGSLINAVVSGALAFVIVKNEKKKKEIERLSNYIFRLEGLELFELNSLRNLIIFEQDEFIQLLLEVKNELKK